MNLLAIETATDQLGVALVTEDRLLASYELLAERPHAIELPQAVTRVLQAAGQSLDRLDGIVVDIGPGSFTGLRIGVAFVKALTFRTNTPVVGVASLDVLAATLPYAPHRICPILDAKQRKVYAALYKAEEAGVRKQTDYSLLSLDELVPMLTDSVILLGDGAGLYRARLEQALGARARFAPPELWLPRAATLGRLGLERLQRGIRDDPRTLVPMYLYPRDCTVRAPNPPSAPPLRTAHAA